MRKRISFVLIVALVVSVINVVPVNAATKSKVPKTSITKISVRDANSISLSWKKATGAKKYKVYRSSKEGKGYKLVKTTTKTNFVNSKLKYSTRYYYKVKAVNASGEGKFSKIKSIKTRKKPIKKKADPNKSEDKLNNNEPNDEIPKIESFVDVENIRLSLGMKKSEVKKKVEQEIDTYTNEVGCEESVYQLNDSLVILGFDGDIVNRIICLSENFKASAEDREFTSGEKPENKDTLYYGEENIYYSTDDVVLYYDTLGHTKKADACDEFETDENIKGLIGIRIETHQPYHYKGLQDIYAKAKQGAELEADYVTNYLRARHNLTQLKPSKLLYLVSDNHSKDMAAYNYVGHGDSTEHSMVYDFYSKLEKKYHGIQGFDITDFNNTTENVGGGYSCGTDVVVGWYNSTGHRAAMLNSYSDNSFDYLATTLCYTEKADHKVYWTQAFTSEVNGFISKY